MFIFFHKICFYLYFTRPDLFQDLAFKIKCVGPRNKWNHHECVSVEMDVCGPRPALAPTLVKTDVLNVKMAVFTADERWSR